MGKYKVEVKEFLSKIVEIEAKSIEEAITKVKEKYDSSEIVLDYSDFVDVDFVDGNLVNKEDEKDELTKEIIEYLFDSEKKHFEEYEEKPINHIYNKLVRLKELI